jgi:pilus assembly protein CpaE
MRAFIASDDERVSYKVREILLRSGHDCPPAHVMPLEQITNRLAAVPANLKPEVVLVGLSPDPDRGLDVLPVVRRATAAPVLAVGPTGSGKPIISALQKGAAGYIDETELEAELVAALNRLKQETAAPARAGHLTAVISPSGGCGGSTIAANLATMLATNYQSCALFDLKLGGGDLAALLDLQPTYTIADLCRKLDHIDRTSFEQSLVRHSSGVHLLAPPNTFLDIAFVTAEGVANAIVTAKSMYPFVVADLDDAFHREQAETLRAADQVLLVIRLDFSTLRNARRTLDALTQVCASRDRIQVVVNRYGLPKEVPPSKAEEALGVKIKYYIPDDARTINLANNNGVPVVLDAPTSKVARAIQQLAQHVGAACHAA